MQLHGRYDSQKCQLPSLLDPPPPPPVILRGGVGLSKSWVGQNLLLERVYKPKKGGWWRGVATFFTTLQFSSVTFTLSVGKVSYPIITFRIFSLLS